MKNSKRSHSLVLASAALISFLILVSSAASASTVQSASPVINITQISSSGIATHPDIYSDKIVWEEDYSNGYASNIYVYNLSASEVEASFGASGSPPCPRIYGNTIVWVDARNGYRDGDYYISSSDIYMYDLSTGKETLITIPPCNAGSHDVYGNRIVWQHGTDTVNVYIYDVSTRYLHNITQIGTGRSAINPAIYSDRVVYQDGRNGYPQIYMYNNSTQNETLITNGEINRTIEGVNPAIYGDKIVWLNPNTNYGDIHMYDLSTSKETQITTSGSASSPAIYGNRIVWADYRNGSPDIYMYDIFTSQETQVTTSGLATSPAIYGDRIVWTYGRYRESDIYMGTISEEEPEPVLPVTNFSATPTSGKAPLNVNFTDNSTGAPTAWKWNFGDGTNSTLQNPKHTYSKAGNYTVKLTATNDVGSNTKTKSSYIKVTAVTKPVANFTSNVTSGKAPLNVGFTDKSTGAPTAWKWTFGDGTNSTTKNPTHRYMVEGNYTVALTATNTAGSNTTTKTNYMKVTTNTRPGIYSSK